MHPLASIPSPTFSEIHLGPLTVHMYAIMILIGIGVAVWLGDRRWQARGGLPGEVADIAVWAVPFGILGGRLYHLATDPELMRMVAVGLAERLNLASTYLADLKEQYGDTPGLSMVSDVLNRLSTHQERPARSGSARDPDPEY